MMTIEVNKYLASFRCNKHINSMIEDIMKIQDCDKSTAIRLVLQYFLEMGGTELIS